MWSLRYKLLVFGVILHAGILIAYFLVITNLVREGMVSNLAVSAKQTSEILNLAIAPYSSERRFDLLQVFFKEMLENSPDGLQYIVVRAEDGGILVSAGTQPKGGLPEPTRHVQQAIQSGIYHYRQEVLIGTNTVGTVQFGLITRSIALVVQQVTGVALIMGLLGLALAVVSLTFFVNNFSRRLQTLIEAADAMASGQYDKKVPEPGKDEVSKLAHNFNRMSNAVQLRERKLLAIFNSVPVPMSLLSRPPGADQYGVDDMNPAARQIFSGAGAVADISLLHPLERFVRAEDRSLFISQLEQFNSSEPLETSMRSGSGAVLQCLVTGGLFDLAGTRYLAMAMIDVTKLRAIEGELRTLNVDLEQRVEDRTLELARRNDELGLSLDRLQKTQQQLVQSEKLAGLGSIVAAVAHELNTPLGNCLVTASALGDITRKFLELIESGRIRRSELQAYADSVREGMQLLQRGLTRSADLVTNFKRVAVDQSSSQRRNFQLKETVEGVVALMNSTLRKLPYKIQVEIPPDIYMDSYPGPLEQIITNLIDNSVLHGFSGRDYGVMTLRASADATHVRLIFSDDGVGMSEDVLSHVFDPFFTTRFGQGGSGLGMSISYNLATGPLEGSIEVATESGHGCTFTMVFPIKIAAV